MGGTIRVRSISISRKKTYPTRAGAWVKETEDINNGWATETPDTSSCSTSPKADGKITTVGVRGSADGPDTYALRPRWEEPPRKLLENRWKPLKLPP